MKIESAQIKFNTQHQLKKQQHSAESVRFWKNAPPPTNPPVLSQSTPLIQTEKTNLDTSAKLDPKQNLMVSIISRLYKQITGEDLKLFSPEQVKAKLDSIEAVGITYQEPPANIPPRSSLNSPGFGLVYQRTDSYSESESSAFSSEGTIITEDGQELNFSVTLTMSREFQTTSQTLLTAGEPEKKDPLVLNFDGNAAELSNTRFAFDIDSDGSLDQINLLKPASGFLALDHNNDGVINDGTELFGAKSGQGFTELAAYDQDQNHFIDENDAIYQKLRIWQRFEDGSQQLLALGDKNIGAIFLGHATTPFQLKNTDQQTLGDIKTSGIFLTEQGQVGTVQQLDLSV